MPQVTLTRNIALSAAATGGQTSIVNEPTAAAFNDELYVTGNWFASHSSDGGGSWAALNPTNALAAPTNAGAFCCDQLTLHEHNRNLWLWLLQYRRNASGTNVFRIAVSTSGKPGPPWTYWDFGPGMLNTAWANFWFDYPHAATSNDHLYVSYNMFDNSSPNSNWVRAVVFRFPLDDIVNKQTLNYEWWAQTSYGSLRLTKGATSDMYFASHLGGSGNLRVWDWPDAPGSSISSFDVSPQAWSGGGAGGYSAPTPDGFDWLGWIDSRITGAWTSGSQAGFLWTVLPRPGRSQPYVKAVTVDTGSKSIVAEPDIWNSSIAFAYPATCPNASGVVGISLFYASTGSYPTHGVGYSDTSGWIVAPTVTSTNGPSNNKWGDYLSCETHDPDATEWIASGYSLQGGNALNNIEPRFVQFSASP